MTVLAVETATAVCAAALIADGQVIAQETVTREFVHAERLLVLIQQVLMRSERTPEDLDGIAVSIGPGSFTGLRVGLATGKGLSYALGKPLITVPTLEALSLYTGRGGGVPEGTYILPVIDARRDEVYAQLFRFRSDTVSAAWEPRDVRVGDLAGMTDGYTILVTGDGAQKVQRALSETTAHHMERFRFAEDRVSHCSAETVGVIGERMLRNGDTADPVTAEPMYIKEFYTKKNG
jgi:tRNA threonylcarbamoyladenosine biosynthesis protein TsaB